MAVDIGETKELIEILYQPEALPTDIGENKQIVEIDYAPNAITPNIVGSVIEQQFEINFMPFSSPTLGGGFEQDLNILGLVPVALRTNRQFYKTIFHISWTPYTETEFNEFVRYEVHRSNVTFSPSPGDGTMIFSSTNAATVETYWDAAGIVADDHFICVLVVLNSILTPGATLFGRSQVQEANHVPIWTPDSVPFGLIHNDGTDNLTIQDYEYDCSCSEITDPEETTVSYHFQYCARAFLTPEHPQGWVFNFGTSLWSRFVECIDKRVITAPGYGVRVAGELWTCVGDDVADLSGYGSTDKVYIYDEAWGYIVFGDNINGQIPDPGAEIKVDYSTWVDITTTDPATANVQTWDVESPPLTNDYKMRAFGTDATAMRSTYEYGIHGQAFAMFQPFPRPVLIAPYNTETIHTFFPQFVFQGHSSSGAPLQYRVEVSVVPDFLPEATWVFDQTTNPELFYAPTFASGATAYLTPTEANMIAPNNTYYWRVRMYDTVLRLWSGWAYWILTEHGHYSTWRFTIADATYFWRVGLSGHEVKFRPLQGGWTVETKQVGPEKVMKRTFKVNFMPMQSALRALLYAEYDRRVVLKLWDNLGYIYDVYWGDCDRALSGKALPPDNAVFGIEQINYVPGAIWYGGVSSFTEV